MEVWFLDEARVGQTGRVCRQWFERGTRPRGVRDLRPQAVYLFGAVCPERNAGVALVLPTVGATGPRTAGRPGWMRGRWRACALWSCVAPIPNATA